MSNEDQKKKWSRRDVLKLGLASGAAAAVGASLFAPRKARAAVYVAEYPVSPLILNPFTDALPVPMAQRPVTDGSVWFDPANHDSAGGRPHQVTPAQLGLPAPILYRIPLQVSTHQFTTSPVQTKVGFWDTAGVLGPRDAFVPPGTIVQKLPPSTIYGFNGAFPGSRINAEYGKPVMIRFVNELDQNPLNLDRQDFGAPNWHFLTHLHNGHTAPESDGNPHYQEHGYAPGEYADNLYLNYPAGGDDREKQSFLWFHDHQHSHTGANVYKGMVGLYPIYDPLLDSGDERKGFRLPGVRTNNADGSFDVAYDIPLAFYDVRLDDGDVKHGDKHTMEYQGQPPYTFGGSHPEWWGKTFFQHIPNDGFVGDIFTVNCVAYPVLHVERRKYRFRMLGASIARAYDMCLMSSTGGPVTAESLGYSGDELQGQYRLPDGQQCMTMLQIATDGGLIPTPIVRDSCEIWPAKRREFVVDFTKYLDGTPTTKGDVIYLVNKMKMRNGRKPDSFDPDYKVPMVKIVIGDLPAVPDQSLVPTQLRAVPVFPYGEWKKLLDSRRVFRLERGSDPFDPENEWLINGRPFDPTVPLAFPKLGSYEVWEIQNGGGGWTHPMHIHQEEHRVVMRNGKPVPTDPRHVDDISREDVVALDPGESVVICREFRTFTGPYVAHCHNLAHEDHAMMFGWKIVP